MRLAFSSFTGLTLLVTGASAQYYKRLGGCPKLGCIFPPDQTEFLPNTYFDIRLEVHAPVNGSEAFRNGVADDKFTFCISKSGGKCEDVSKSSGILDIHAKASSNPPLEKWSFNYFEDLFAKDAGQSTAVNVASKVYRALSFKKPGTYEAKLKYYGTSETVARWTVRDGSKKRTAKNVILFIGDGMTQPMITAARLIAHKSINGKYQSLMQMDQMEALGHQMTHSLDSFITDSANSATALYTGHKSSVNALNVYADSSAYPFDDPKFETIAEIFRRRIGGTVGMVSTADIADATPAAVCTHTRVRDELAAIAYEYLVGSEGLNSSIPWPTGCKGPDVIFGGGAEHFFPGSGSYNKTDVYKLFKDGGYNLVYDKDQLAKTSTKDKTLGIFSVGNMAKWLDREVYPQNVAGHKDHPSGNGSDAINQPGLKDMTLKAIDILDSRSKGKGFFLMSEAASIDKQMHVLDYDRALGELLELDDTIRATIAHLKKIGEADNTLIVVTADHGHGFDVFGGVDTKYLAAQTGDRKKRGAVGTYVNSGLSGYTVPDGISPLNDTIAVGNQGSGFPVNWAPRYTYAGGFGANPDRREGYTVNKSGPRLPAVPSVDGYVLNPSDEQQGFIVSGTLATTEAQGVHSLQDVSVFAHGPGSEAFRGVYNNVDIFFKIADAFGLGQ